MLNIICVCKVFKGISECPLFIYLFINVADFTAFVCLLIFVQDCNS